MRKFIFKVAIFIFPIVFLLLSMEYNLGTINNSYTYKRHNLENQIQQLEVINLGSSHGNYGFDPDYYDFKGFNMANVSQSLYYDYFIFNKYIDIDKAKNLKVVMLPISYFTLGFNMTDSPEYWREFFYERFYEIPNEDDSKIYDLKKYSLFALYGNKESFIYMVKLFKINLAEGFKENGGAMGQKFNVEGKNISDDKGKERVNSHNKSFDNKNVSQNRFYLEKIIKECEEKNIVPVIVTTPVYKTYSNNMNIDIWNITQDNIKDIQKRYRVRYFNYLSDERFIKEDFRDNDHLNPKGAEKFSKIINEEILKTYIKR